MERQVEKALKTAGDSANAFLWRRICRHLSGKLRIGIAGRDEGTVRRLIQQVAEQNKEVRWVQLLIDDLEDPGLGMQDAMLGAHALLWATPLAAALGSEERECLTKLHELGCPEQRAVFLADSHLLSRITDDPEREAKEVRRRVTNLIDDSWHVCDETELPGWITQKQKQLSQLASQRRRAVGRLLLAEARQTAEEAVFKADHDVVEVELLLTQKDAALTKARQRGERTAAHMLGTMRRHTEQLLVDLRAFLEALEQRLQAEIAEVDQAELVRQTLPHWLNHVVEHWMRQRLDQWTVDVMTELKEGRITEEDAQRAQLLIPALH
ncbi:MAG: hypothetical protein HN348_11595, partial [Proteobacteria bacterium]|nr:hypothetical protein [Pseudomonadota bacterium]